MEFDIREHSHRRYNPLTGEWIQVSPHRAKRPWQGKTEDVSHNIESKYDPNCYLCPGNPRSNGERNPRYESTYSFVNDFSAIVPDVPYGKMNENNLLIAQSERGICKVICFSPDHSLTIAVMPVSGITKVIEQWVSDYNSLKQYPYIKYIQIFENKGEIMGCSNPHPHGQIWAQESIPIEPLKKHQHQQEYYKNNNTTLLSDYLALELKKNERVVLENEHFVVVVPFWATWPYETMLIPKRPMATITELTESETKAFAEMYKGIAVKYDNLFETSFPYSAGIHQAPCDYKIQDGWHWHMVFYPPLLRSATVKKFMVGYELLANPQRDITAEYSAQRLKALPDIHFKHPSFPREIK